MFSKTVGFSYFEEVFLYNDFRTPTDTTTAIQKLLFRRLYEYYFCTYYRGTKHGGTSRSVRCIEVYVIASQFSMELMLFRRRVSAIVRNSEVCVISRVVISGFDLHRVGVAQNRTQSGNAQREYANHAQ